jgi:DNA-binding CsgD family transcriptional regulator/tetratricopeptide (TPR) repeat protein
MPTTLFGRTAEVETLRAVLRRAARGTGAAAVIEGEAGVGKTRLLRDLVTHARETGATVWYGRAEELARSRPFGVLAEAFAGTAAPAVDLLRAVASGRPPPDNSNVQYLVAEDLLNHIEQVAAAGPTVLALDDVQWADPATLLTVLGLTRRFARLPIALVVALRPFPGSTALDRLLESLHQLGARHVRLGPLSEDAVAELLADALDAAPGPHLLALIRRAGGNPFYLHELVRALSGGGELVVRDGVADIGEATFPVTLGTTILRHLRFLSEDAVTVLEQAAVLGSTFTAAELAAVGGRPADQLVAPLKEAVRAEVLHDRPDGFSFHHDLVREALYERIPRGVRRELHAAAGRALAAIGAPATRVASQSARGAVTGDAEAISHLRAAAEETRSSAPDIAVGFLEQAIGLARPADPAGDQMRADLACLLVATGRHAAAYQLIQQVLSAEHDGELDGVLRFTGGQAMMQLHRTEAPGWLAQAAEAGGLTDAERALVLVEATITGLAGTGDLPGAERDAARAVELAESAGDRYARGFALAARSLVLHFRGEVTAAVAAAASGVALVRGATDPRRNRLWSPVRDPYMMQGWALLEADRFDEAEAAFHAGERLSTARGITGWCHYYQLMLGLRHFHAGAWDDAVAELEAGLAYAVELGGGSGPLGGHALLGLIALHRHLAQAGKLLADTGPEIGLDWLELGLSLRAEATGDAEAALTHLAQTWDAMAELGSRAHYRMLGPPLVRLAIAAGSDHAARVTRELEALAAREPVAGLQVAALRCRGLLDRDEEPLLAAVTAAQGCARPLARAAACEDAATVIGADARRLLSAALEDYLALGADHDAARVTARLRALGVRTGVRGPRNRPASGWESLTATERKVAALVAEGLSNPEVGNRLFISRRTVQTHVSHIFAKLQVSSRAELAAEAGRRSAIPPDGDQVVPGRA